MEKIEGVPAGIRTDDNVFIATKGLLIYSPKGELLKNVGMAQTPSDHGFGDKDFSSLYVTARTAVYRVRADGMKGTPPYAPQVP